MGNSYRLMKSGATFNVAINGIQQKTFFTGDVSLTKAGKNLMLEVDKIGLVVSWDGNHAIQVKLCSTYRSYVCGLCGNFDGNYPRFFLQTFFEIKISMSYSALRQQQERSWKQIRYPNTCKRNIFLHQIFTMGWDVAFIRWCSRFASKVSLI